MIPANRAALVAQARTTAIHGSRDTLADMGPTMLIQLADALEESESALAARDERIRALVEKGDEIDYDLTHGYNQYYEDIDEWRAVAHPEQKEMKT